jgi:hypothetical protein
VSLWDLQLSNMRIALSPLMNSMSSKHIREEIWGTLWLIPIIRGLQSKIEIKQEEVIKFKIDSKILKIIEIINHNKIVILVLVSIELPHWMISRLLIKINHLSQSLSRKQFKNRHISSMMMKKRMMMRIIIFHTKNQTIWNLITKTKKKMMMRKVILV